MSVLVISVDQESLNYEQIVQLEGIEYLFSFLWLERNKVFILGIYDQDKNPIAIGIRISVNWPLLYGFVDERLPPGVLTAFDTSLQEKEIEVPSDLGGRVLLLYTTSDDESLAEQ